MCNERYSTEYCAIHSANLYFRGDVKSIRNLSSRMGTYGQNMGVCKESMHGVYSDM